MKISNYSVVKWTLLIEVFMFHWCATSSAIISDFTAEDVIACWRKYDHTMLASLALSLFKVHMDR